MQIHARNTINNTLINFKGDVRYRKASLFDRNKLCSFDVEHPEIGTLQVSSKKRKNGEYIIQVGTKNDPKISRETFDIDDNNIYGCSIRTSDLYKRQHLAEITRLTSIITMLKNGFKSIKIFSLDDAVMFHSKYKFEPDITNTYDASVMLAFIKASNIQEYVSQIEKILKELNETKNEEKYLKETNRLVKSFIEETKMQVDTRLNQYNILV